AARGHRVGIVARGYRKRRPGPVVGGADGRAPVSAEDGGDEAVMLARRFAGPGVTGERPREAASLGGARLAVDASVRGAGCACRAVFAGVVAVAAGLGGRVRDVLRFPDRYAYTAADAARIAEAARLGLVVTTEKDLVKLERFPGLEALLAVRVELEFDREDALLDLLERAA